MSNMNIEELSILFSAIICALGIFYIVIGIFNICAKKPVSFYRFEVPLNSSQLVDVAKWNKCHGMMWIILGAVICITALPAFFIKESTVYQYIALGLCVVIGVPAMMIYHKYLKNKYLKK